MRAAGIAVWVTVIRTLDEAFVSLRRMFEVALGWPQPPWLAEAERVWRDPAPSPRTAAVIPVWRDPWMVVGAGTFTGDLAARLGLDNVYDGDPGRYPHVDLGDVIARRPELVVLPDEPYAFGPDNGPEMFPRQRVALVEGRSLTWYGPSLVTARGLLSRQLAVARPPADPGSRTPRALPSRQKGWLHDPRGTDKAFYLGGAPSPACRTPPHRVRADTGSPRHRLCPHVGLRERRQGRGYSRIR
jgi:hypothetical protein